MVTRGCGRRVEGGIYLECPTSPDGEPIEHFLIDPPRPVNPAEMGVTPVGVHRIGQHRLFDWVGESFYPNVADFVEEVRRFGMSRRVAETFDFSALVPGTRSYFAHSRAILFNWEGYEVARVGPCRAYPCPKGYSQHPARTISTSQCARLWWQDLRDGESLDDPDDPRARRRTVGETSYLGWCAPNAVSGMASVGLFLWLPVRRVAVVRARDGRHRQALDKARRCRLPVDEVDE